MQFLLCMIENNNDKCKLYYQVLSFNVKNNTDKQDNYKGITG